MTLPGSETTPVRYKPRSDALQLFFQRPLFLSLTIGIPFCIFKLLFGLAVVHAGSIGMVQVTVFGWMVICWSILDLGMNLGREWFDILGRPAPFEYCTLAQIGRYFHRPMAFLALDTLLTFTIICTMLWSGWITLLKGIELHLWYAATTLNLISLSLVILYNEIRNS
jgi:hypothetical protein